MINRERLIARRDELQRQFEQTRANLIALQGAITDLDFLLKEDEDSGKESETE